MSLEALGDEVWPDGSEDARKAGWLDPADFSRALLDVRSERDRQWNEEGFGPAQDDAHVGGELAQAAASYALASAYPVPEGRTPMIWPWSAEWWKPSGDRRRDLVKAGALILAEIDRLDRAGLARKEPPAETFLLYKLTRALYWAPDRCGYIAYKAAAGRYTRAEAEALISAETGMIPEHLAPEDAADVPLANVTRRREGT